MGERLYISCVHVQVCELQHRLQQPSTRAAQHCRGFHWRQERNVAQHCRGFHWRQERNVRRGRAACGRPGLYYEMCHLQQR